MVVVGKTGDPSTVVSGNTAVREVGTVAEEMIDATGEDAADEASTEAAATAEAVVFLLATHMWRQP